MFELLVRTNPAPVPTMRVGGTPELTASDIAGACAGADDFGLDILLVKVAGNQNIKLFDRLYSLVINMALREKWKVRGKQMRFYDLTSLVMLEYMQEPRCPLCHGTKYYKAKPCEPCKATGYIRLNDTLRARAIGVNRSVWSRIWKQRYGAVVQAVNMHESRAIYSIKQKLQGDCLT